MNPNKPFVSHFKKSVERETVGSFVFFFALPKVINLIFINMDSKQFVQEIGMNIYIQDFAGELFFNNLKVNGHCLCSNVLHCIIYRKFSNYRSWL